MQTFNINTFAYATREQALLSIYHKGTSGIFYIKGVEVVPNSPMAAATPNSTRRTLQRISACSGGFVLPYRKSNLGNADLPAQVQILRRPDAVTYVASNPYRNLMLMPISLAGLSLRSGGRMTGVSSMSGTADIWTTSRDTRVQGLILREGEGFAFGTSSPAVPAFPVSMWLTVTLRNTADNHTYFVFTQLSPEEMKEASFAIMNGAGSGITLEIVDMELGDLGSPLNALPLEASYLRFVRTFGHDGGGSVLIPSANNLANAVPTSLDVRKNFIGDDLNPFFSGRMNGVNILEDLGYPSLNVPLTRKVGTFGTRLAWQGAVGGAGINSFGSSIMPGRWLYGGMSGDTADNMIALRPGEGFAVVQSNNTAYAEFYIEATILYDKTDYTPEEIAEAVWTRSGRTLT